MQKEEILEDFKPGPLDYYRKKSSFNWKKLKIIVETEEALKFKLKIWKAMEHDPLFHHSPYTPTLDEYRRLTTLRYYRLKDLKLSNTEDVIEVPQKFMAFGVAVNQYDPSLLLKYSVPFDFFPNSVRGLGTEKHQILVEAALKEQINGCFALTEVAHGTNAKNMRTIATFDPKTQEFILNSPDFEAAKCWIGSLGKSATHATVYAQLITPDGLNHGLHAFVTPVRDPVTMLPYPGVTVGDMGEKIGLNAVDNGFAMFDNYHIPKESLLDRTGTVTVEGKYVPVIKDPKKKFGTSLSALAVGRLVITGISAANLISAASIAIRYSAVRRQFGPSGGEELPVLEYQTQQWRLFPLLASAFVMKVFNESLAVFFLEYQLAALTKQDMDNREFIGTELHALLSSAKPLCSWIAQRGIQECRESCGGHGYLACAGFGRLRNDNDANCTYEGENNVLCQQTSNWLLQLWKQLKSTSRPNLDSPLGSVSFLNKTPPLKFNAYTEDVTQPEFILSAYEWIIKWLLQESETEYERNIRMGKDAFTAKNDSQVYYARTLSIVYAEHYLILNFWRFCKNQESDKEIFNILQTLCSLFGLWRLETHIDCLAEGQFSNNPKLPRLIHKGILNLCSLLKNDAIALVDAIAPPDFILHSALGMSDGEVYKHIKKAFFESPAVTERPSWWQEMSGKYRSKL